MVELQPAKNDGNLSDTEAGPLDSPAKTESIEENNPVPSLKSSRTKGQIESSKSKISLGKKRRGIIDQVPNFP